MRVDGMLCEPAAVGRGRRDSIVCLMDLWFCGSELAGGRAVGDGSPWVVTELAGYGCCCCLCSGVNLCIMVWGQPKWLSSYTGLFRQGGSVGIVALLVRRGDAGLMARH